MSRHIVVLVEELLRTVSKGSMLDIIASPNILLVNLPKDQINEVIEERLSIQEERNEEIKRIRNRRSNLKSVVQKQNIIECL